MQSKTPLFCTTPPHKSCLRRMKGAELTLLGFEFLADISDLMLNPLDHCLCWTTEAFVKVILTAYLDKVHPYCSGTEVSGVTPRINLSHMLTLYDSLVFPFQISPCCSNRKSGKLMAEGSPSVFAHSDGEDVSMILPRQEVFWHPAHGSSPAVPVLRIFG